MRPKDLKEFARKYADVWRSDDPEEVLALHSESSRLFVNDEEPAVGKQAISNIVEGFMEGFPDLYIQFNEVVEEGRGIVFFLQCHRNQLWPGWYREQGQYRSSRNLGV